MKNPAIVICASAQEQAIEQAANRINMIVERIQSHARMDGRDIDAQIADIDAQQKIIADAVAQIKAKVVAEKRYQGVPVVEQASAAAAARSAAANDGFWSEMKK